MAFCTNCGKKMGDKAKFCTSCGAPAEEAALAAKPATEKIGNIVKCPNCDAVIPAMTAVCPECGYEFRNAGVSSSLNTFAQKLQKAGRDEKIALVETFPIPNTREDLLEFVIMASSLAKTEKTSIIGNVNWMVDLREVNRYKRAWVAKCEQVLEKARTVLADDNEFLPRIEDLVARMIEDAKKSRWTMLYVILVLLGLFVGIGFVAWVLEELGLF